VQDPTLSKQGISMYTQKKEEGSQKLKKKK